MAFFSPLSVSFIRRTRRLNLIISCASTVEIGEITVSADIRLVYGIDEEGEWYFNGSGKRPEELKKEEE